MPNTVLATKSAGFISGSGSTVLLPFDTSSSGTGLTPCEIDALVHCDKALTALVEFSPDNANWYPASVAETTVANVAWTKTVLVPDRYMRLSLTSTTTSSTYHVRVVVRSQAQ